MSKYIASLSAFFFTLSSFSYRAALVSFILLFLLLFKIKLREVRVKISSFIFVILGLFSVFISFPFYNPTMLYIVKFLAMLFYSFVFYFYLKSVDRAKGDGLFVAKSLIFIHFSFFILQLTYYLLFNDYLDLNNMIREDEAQGIYMAKALEDSYISIRCTGLYSEPSFYCMLAVPLSVLIYLKEKKISLPVLLGIFSSILSFSVAALVVIAMISVVILFFTRGAYYLKISIVIVSILLVPFFYDYAEKRLYSNADYDAVGSRLVILNEFSQRESFKDIIGSGYFWNEGAPIGVTGVKGYHIRDSSFYSYLYFSGGFISLIIFFAWTYVFMRNKAQLALIFLITLLFKFHLLSALFFTYVLFFMYFSEEEL